MTTCSRYCPLSIFPSWWDVILRLPCRRQNSRREKPRAFSRKKRDYWCLGEIRHRPSATLDFSAPEPVVLLGRIALWRKACLEMPRRVLRTLNSTKGKLMLLFIPFYSTDHRKVMTELQRIFSQSNQ